MDCGKQPENPTMKNVSIITADLDLAKSLSRFQEVVSPLLQLEGLSDWDATTLKQIETVIRTAGLALAGQVIALLLHHLSQSAEARAVAAARTQGQRPSHSIGHGHRSVNILTVGNVEVRLKTPYVVQNTGPGVKGKRSQEDLRGGFYPLLSWLGLTERVSPLVWSTVAEYGTVSASFAVAQGLLEGWGVDLSTRRVERLTYRFGEIGLALRTQQVAALQAGTLPVGDRLKGQRVVISVDGGRTRLRRDKRGRRKQHTDRHGYYGDWREPLLLTIYVVDAAGQKINTAQLPITNDGTFGHHEALLDLLELHLWRLGIQTCAQVLLLADGALWIWNQIPPLLKRLGCPADRIIELLDFYHATEHLQTFAELALEPVQVKTWFKGACSALKHGRVSALLKQMQSFTDSAKGKQREAIRKALQYFTKQPQRLNYAQVAAQKLPIGSGSIESLVRQVVNLRLKGNGKFWLPQHAEIILHGRCQWAAGAWNTFCNSVLTANLAPS
jgi:hypothetical protein